MKFKKTLTAALLVLIMAPASIFAAGKLPPSASDAEISIIIDGQRQVPPQDMGRAYVDKNTNRTMVPIRFISDQMSLNIKYMMKSKDFPKGGILISGNNKDIITMETNSTTAIKTSNTEEKVYTIDAPSIIYDGRTYAPVRFISEALGYKVDWKNNTVYIERTSSANKKEEVPTQEKFLVDGADYYWEKSGTTMILRDKAKNKIAEEDYGLWQILWTVTRQGNSNNPPQVSYNGTNKEFEDRYKLSNKPQENKTSTKVVEGDFGNAASFIRTMNSYRDSYNLPPVVENSDLNRIAQLRAREEIEQYIRTGGMDHHSEGNYIANLGENLAAQYYSFPGQVSSIQDRSFDIWKNSPGHNANMLKDGAVNGGFACYRKVSGDKIYEMSVYVYDLGQDTSYVDDNPYLPGFGF